MKTIYLHNRADRERRTRRLRGFLLILVIGFILILFRPTLSGTVIRFVALPVWFVEDRLAWLIEPLFRSFVARAELIEEAHSARARVDQLEAEVRSKNSALLALAEYRLLFDEAKSGIPAHILSRPPRSPYDTLIVSAGRRAGIVPGSNVYAAPHVAIGVVDEVFETSSRIVLFSSARTEIEAFMDGGVGSVLIKGQGGGTMLTELSRAFTVSSSTIVTLPDRVTVIGRIDHVAGDDTDPFLKVYIGLPINIQNLSWVEIRPSE